jgi:4'-phosphopantetheinyl transferase EntD
LTGLIARLPAPGLFGAEIWDEGQDFALHPEEAIHVAGAADRRRRDFALGRACARTALEGFGHGSAVITKGEDGAPLWPPGIIGSITHTQGYAAALAGERRNFAGIGIDAERAGGVGRDLWPRLFSPAEQEQIEHHVDPLLAATLFFSAKEASYKAWALKGAPGFRDIEIVLEDGGFIAGRAQARLKGCYAVDKGIVLVAAWR